MYLPLCTVADTPFHIQGTVKYCDLTPIILGAVSMTYLFAAWYSCRWQKSHNAESPECGDKWTFASHGERKPGSLYYGTLIVVMDHWRDGHISRWLHWPNYSEFTPYLMDLRVPPPLNYVSGGLAAGSSLCHHLLNANLILFLFLGQNIGLDFNSQITAIHNFKWLKICVICEI